MPEHKLKYGDVIEWDSDRWTCIRWLIIHPSQYGYKAVWLGDDLREVGKLDTIGWPDRPAEEGGWEYQLVSHG